MRMNIDDSRLIAQFQRLITEMLVEKLLGQRRPELTDELYQTWREVEQRGLKETPEYRNVLLRADQHGLWLAGLVRAGRAACVFTRNRVDRYVGCPAKSRLVKTGQHASPSAALFLGEC